MKLYTFVSNNLTNVWAGIGAGMWAVSQADQSIMAARRTRAAAVELGSYGLIYVSDDRYKAFTCPFLIYSRPDPHQIVDNVWDAEWTLPFRIKPLGTPNKLWDAYEARDTLPFFLKSGVKNLTSVFKIVGTAVFSPVQVEQADVDMILSRLADL